MSKIEVLFVGFALGYLTCTLIAGLVLRGYVVTPKESLIEQRIR